MSSKMKPPTVEILQGFGLAQKFKKNGNAISNR
jgi:hypothetical protein